MINPTKIISTFRVPLCCFILILSAWWLTSILTQQGIAIYNHVEPQAIKLSGQPYRIRMEQKLDRVEQKLDRVEQKLDQLLERP